MRHRPLMEKKRSPLFCTFTALFNIAIAVLFYFSRLVESPIHTLQSVTFTLTSAVLLIVSFGYYLAMVYVQPGYLQAKYDFVPLVDSGLDNECDLDCFCAYCKVLKTETSFHCQICRKCVDRHDHHCPFINTCLGVKTHKYFILFLITWTLFIVMVFVDNAYVYIYDWQGDGEVHYHYLTIVISVLLFIYIPPLAM